MNKWMNPKIWMYDFIELYTLKKKIKNSLEKSILQGRLLDIGCGSKPYSAIFSETDYVGIDVKGTMNLKSDARQIPFKSETFDFVLCTQVLEHVFEVSSVVSEIKRVLKPGGTVVCSVPFSFPVHSSPHDYFRFTKSALTKLFSNFSHLSVKGRCSYGATVMQLINRRLFFFNPLKLNRTKPLFDWLKVPFVVFNNLVGLGLDFLEGVSSGNEALPLGYVVFAKK